MCPSPPLARATTMADSPLPPQDPPTVDTKPTIVSPKRSRSNSNSGERSGGQSSSNLPVEEEAMPQVSSAFDDEDEPPKEKKPKKERKGGARSNSRVLNCEWVRWALLTRPPGPPVEPVELTWVSSCSRQQLSRKEDARAFDFLEEEGEEEGPTLTSPLPPV